MARERQQGVVGRFFAAIGRYIRNYFVFIGVLTTLFWGAVIALVMSSQHLVGDFVRTKPALKIGRQMSAEHPSTLVLELEGQIAQKEPGWRDLVKARFFGMEHEIYLPDLRRLLQRAAKDPRIRKLALNFGDLSATGADYAALRRVLSEFRATGKPISAVLPRLHDWHYYVASVAKPIILNPTGEVMLPGPTFSLVYFGEGLRKLGLDIEVVRAGKYKSAFEPLVTNQPSPATVEEYESMGKSLFDHATTLVSEGRGKDLATVVGWYKRSVFTPEEALKAGLVDELGYATEIVSDDDEDGDDDGDGADKGDTDAKATVETISLAAYKAATRHDKSDAESVSSSGGIALIEAVGEISMDSERGPTDPDNGITPERLRRQLEWARTNDEVKAVVLRVSSPGGSATASDLIWHDVKSLAQAKPLVVAMGAYAASGGYYISAPARRLIAEPTTITGSIGVIGMLPNGAAFADKYGVSFHTITRSDRRNLLNFGSKPSAEDKALMDATIASVYATFKQRVAEGRAMKADDVEKLAQGRVYTGLQAKDLGLVDMIGGTPEAFREAKKLAGFDPEKLYPVLHYEKDSFDLSECLGSARQLKRCLKQVGGAVSQVSVWQGGWGSGRYGLEALMGHDLAQGVGGAAVHVRRWLAASREEPAMTLWAGYLGLGTGTTK